MLSLVFLYFAVIQGVFGYSFTTYPAYGLGGGMKNSFECPYNGAIIGVKYRADVRVDQIEFICSSTMGITTFGPYGGSGGNPGELTCPKGQYVSSMYGGYVTGINQLGIRCRCWDDETSIGTPIGKFGRDGQFAFDTKDYSYFSRITGLTIQSDNEVRAIEITYGDIPLDQFCTDGCKYQEVWGNKQGGNGGLKNQFACPNEGVITGIKYYVAKYFDSIQFTCTSAFSETTFGPYGSPSSPGATLFEEKCPPGYYIGSIHGRCNVYVDSLGIRCVKAGQLTSSIKLDAHGCNTTGRAYDDETFQNRGLRPVQIETWSDTGKVLNAVRLKYGNMPVTMNCKVFKIEVMDNTITEQYDGVDSLIMVSTPNCSCSNEPSIQQYYSHTEAILVETDDRDINWRSEVSLVFTTGVNMFVKTKLTVSLTQSQSACSYIVWQKMREITEFGSGNDSVNRFVINKGNVPVQYHYNCEEGSVPPRSGTIKLSSKVYGKAFSRKECVC